MPSYSTVALLSLSMEQVYSCGISIGQWDIISAFVEPRKCQGQSPRHFRGVTKALAFSQGCNGSYTCTSCWPGIYNYLLILFLGYSKVSTLCRPSFSQTFLHGCEIKSGWKPGNETSVDIDTVV